MPTGYTSDLYDLKPVTRNEFILKCARAFGATIEQRDDPLSVLPKPRIARTEYMDSNILRAKRERREAVQWTKEEAIAQAKKKNDESLAYWEEANKKALARRRNYERILAEVDAWTPPTPDHVELKNFMIDQLRSSIEWDCKMYDPPTPTTGEEYRHSVMQQADRDVEYYTKERQAEIDRASGSNGWITSLYNSLENYERIS
jgi:hypothetical protein